MGKEVTIYDIAEKAGVSATTVSRALNDSPAVNKATRKKIFDIAAAFEYQSNVFASNLRKKTTNNIGIIVPRLNSSFQSSVLSGMENVASKAGYNLIISQSLESSEKEKANVRTMFMSRVDGLLVSLAGNTNDLDHFKPLINKGIPIIFFDRAALLPDFTSVVIDNVKAGYNATNHLIQQGYTCIAHVVGNININVYADRLKGYKYALIDHELPYDTNYVLSSDLTEESGEAMANWLLKLNPMPEAVFVSSDAAAASCIRFLKIKGVRIPDDLAVVGFNNDIISRMIEPNLTTTNYPGYEMGEVAMKNLINHLNGQAENLLQNTNTITLRSELIIRESSLRKVGKLV